MTNEIKVIFPSLSINVTDNCNLQCIYCPPFGENFVKCKNLCSINSIVNLVSLACKYKLPVIRLTGGEPLLFPERVEKILHACKKSNYSKVILNTNGTLIKKNIDLLETYKDIFLLKISLDTVDNEMYNVITRTQKYYTEVIEALELAVERNFKVELNAVITKTNFDGIINLIDFAESSGIDIKLFGINNFEGKVSGDLYAPLDDIVNVLDKLYIRCEKEGLPGDRGIKMLKYNTFNGNRILIVDHNSKSKFNNEEKSYAVFCQSCNYYPCASGLFSITLRADGLLQTCRMRPEKGKSISNLNEKEIDRIFATILEPYKECYLLKEE